MIRRLFLHALLLLAAVSASAQGVPFLETFTPEEYGGHCINFDIKTGQEGTVFVANFEGLMYYDHAAWTVLHTSGITRVTTTFCDSNNNIWAGGYNYFGRVDRQPNGQLILKRVGGPDLFRGEVLEMWEKDGYLMFVVFVGDNQGKGLFVDLVADRDTGIYVVLCHHPGGDGEQEREDYQQ